MNETDRTPDITDATLITESLVFRYGTDMSPEAIIAETPGARFVARARLVADWATTSPACAELADAGPAVSADAEQGSDDEVWGILLIQPESTTSTCAADVITDAGYRTHATVLTGEDALSDREGLITQARYWELSPAYIRRLSLVAS
ncbi:MAG TPA: hypothetical protein VGT61_14320 [Thermomicrobiales bacterium]|jgi:hypothetical protein|nr:hypothetical protein [Thermomicrobiales bacterium]